VRAKCPQRRNPAAQAAGLRNSRPVSASYLADYLGRHQRGISLEHMAETLATGTDPLHLSLVFTIDHTNAMAYANAARDILTGPAGQTLAHRPA
jgi:hypothetical protein